MAYFLFQMKPTRCTLLLSIFISNSLHVSGSYVTIIRRIYCIHATLEFFTLYGWLSMCRWVDNIRMDVKGVGCVYMDWIGFVQDRDRWRTLVSAVMNLRVP